jgi:hypothetical protein
MTVRRNQWEAYQDTAIRLKGQGFLGHLLIEISNDPDQCHTQSMEVGHLEQGMLTIYLEDRMGSITAEVTIPQEWIPDREQSFQKTLELVMIPVESNRTESPQLKLKL